MRGPFGSTAKALAKRKLKYYRISESQGWHAAQVMWHSRSAGVNAFDELAVLASEPGMHGQSMMRTGI